MPEKYKKQHKFFELVKSVQEGTISPARVPKEVRKVARSISSKDSEKFLKEDGDLKLKKAVLSTIKDCREPMYLDEYTEDNKSEMNAITKEFNVEGKFEEYVERYLGQNLSEKEMEAVNTFQDIKPTKIESNQIRYETTDEFKNNTTTIIKKLMEGSDFVYVAFTKYGKVEKPQDQQQGGDMGGMGGPSSMFEYVRKEPQIYLNYPEPSKPFLMEQGPLDPLGAPDPSGIMSPMQPGPALPPPTSTAPMQGTPKSSDQKKKEMGIDDILIRKSTTFKDDIKGGAILANFLKKLDL